MLILGCYAKIYFVGGLGVGVPVDPPEPLLFRSGNITNAVAMISIGSAKLEDDSHRVNFRLIN